MKPRAPSDGAEESRVPSAEEGIAVDDYRRLASFRHALRRFARFSEQAAGEAGLTPAQHQALLAIKGHAGEGAMTIGALAQHLVVAPHTAAELVGRLEAAELVRRVADPQDARRVGLALTGAAEVALGKLTLVHLRELRAIAPQLSAILAVLSDC